MERIAAAFDRARTEKRALFMPYLVAGDPDLETSKRLILALAEAGAGMIELGVPFSDPMADGPTNQLAAQRALASGTTLPGILAMVKELRADCDIPINLMGYLNPFYRYGLETLFHDAAEAGVDGFIIPDLQPDDVAEVRAHADATGVATVFLIAPTSTPERLALVARESRGFVYAVSLTGVTGERQGLPPDLADFVARAREHIKLPIAVGFGISAPETAQAVGAVADGVIVGSAIVRRVAEASAAGSDPVPPVRDFAASLVAALAAS